MSEKKYIKGSIKPFGQYGALKLSIHIDQLQEIQNGKGYCNIILSPRKEIGQYGDTYSLILDEWKPKEQEQEEEFKTGSYGNARSKEEEIDPSQIPF